MEAELTWLCPDNLNGADVAETTAAAERRERSARGGALGEIRVIPITLRRPVAPVVTSQSSLTECCTAKDDSGRHKNSGKEP